MTINEFKKMLDVIIDSGKGENQILFEAQGGFSRYGSSISLQRPNFDRGIWGNFKSSNNYTTVSFDIDETTNDENETLIPNIVWRKEK